MKRTILTTTMIITFSVLLSQVNFIVNSIPDYTPSEDIIYIAGDLNGWDPGNPDFAMVKSTSDSWEITLPNEPTGTIIQFKFTRGNWNIVEKGAQGEEVANREFVYGNGDTVFVEIFNWADNGGGGNSTAAENVSVMDDNFHMPQLNRDRRIWIYLPPDYDSNSEKYPVLYMHDGQNLFDTFTSFSGEWEVDETLNELYDEGYKVPIVVGIDNGGGDRINEYIPWVNTEYGGGQGSEYVEFLVNTLKPYIDANYRTHSNRENTGIMGSSLGGLIKCGLIPRPFGSETNMFAEQTPFNTPMALPRGSLFSLYGALKYQNVYGKSGIFSPAYWISDSVWAFTNGMGKQQSISFYQIIGTLEGQEYVSGMWQMDSVLNQLGYGDNELFSNEDLTGSHNEAFWRAHFRDAYLWMFTEYANDIEEEVINNPLSISPSPVINKLEFNISDHVNYDTMRVIDATGKQC